MSEQPRCELAFVVPEFGQVVCHVLVCNSSCLCQSMEGAINASVHAALIVCWDMKVVLFLEVFGDLAQLESHALWVLQQTLEVHHLHI